MHADDELELQFLGPLLNVTRVEDHLPLFANVFGLEARAIQELDEVEVESLWGVRGRSAGTVLLETGESRTGVRLIQFEPQIPTSPRERTVANNGNPLRAIEFLTGNFEIARNVVERANYSFRVVSRYSLSGFGRFTEAQIEAPDGLICTVVRMHDRPMLGIVRLSDRLFGELLSVSVSAAQLDPVRAFYELIGLHEITSLEGSGTDGGDDGDDVEHPPVEDSFRFGVRYGRSSRAPLITLVHDPLSFVPPVATLDHLLVRQHGCVALRFQTNSIELLRRRLSAAEGRGLGARILRSGKGILQPIGAIESLLVSSPHGVVHQFLGRL